MAQRITPRKRAAIAAGLKTGAGITQLAKKHGVSPSAVKKIRIDEGLQPLPTEDAKQLAANARDALLLEARRRRAELMVNLLGDAEKLRLQLWSPSTVYNFGGKENTFEQAELPEADTRSKQSLMIAIGIAIDKSLVLEKHDQESAASARAAIIELVDRLSDGGLNDEEAEAS